MTSAPTVSYNWAIPAVTLFVLGVVSWYVLQNRICNDLCWELHNTTKAEVGYNNESCRCELPDGSFQVVNR